MTDLPEDLFTLIYRRAPTEQDRARLLAVKAGLGLSPRDEIWPVLMVLDYYERAIRSSRIETLRDVELVLDELKAIPERAGPIASAEAQKAIARIIKDASEEIARTAAQRTITTADRISRRQFIVAAIVGALIAVCLAGAAAWGMYLSLEARGLCAEPPFLTGDGRVGCFIQR
ncbi:hypothetical protein [Marivita sp. XM-24bin2]|uniref:hypothetical protein n=1 Tax=Marivita sp. XM-24bin2 TaxID=2133951 RepID=UPI000D7A14A1|nr:hypothetical protein [Marivita sp. XM-24bin2]PWL28089.1 MAG: hypothetical protein DCO97_21830 [Marivita sp. XM-24bin2]